MSSAVLVIPGPRPASARPRTAAATLRAFVVDGLAPDAALRALGPRLMAVRLVFPAAAAKRCCAGHAPAFVAIDPEDPTVAVLDRRALEALTPGRAVPGAGLRALAGGTVALPGLEIEIAPATDLGPGLEHVVVLTLADAARGLVHAGEADAMTPGTVAVVHGAEPLPAPWRAASGEGEWVSLDAGLAALTELSMAA